MTLQRAAALQMTNMRESAVVSINQNQNSADYSGDVAVRDQESEESPCGLMRVEIKSEEKCV